MRFIIKVGDRNVEVEGTAEVTDLGFLNPYVTDKEGVFIALARQIELVSAVKSDEG